MGRSRSPRRDRSRSRSPPRRGGGGGGYRSRSPPRGGGGGGNGRGSERQNGERISLLVRNIGDRTDLRDLKDAFARYGDVKDVYVPTDYSTK